LAALQIEKKQCGDLKDRDRAPQGNRSSTHELSAARLMLISPVWPALFHCGVRMPTQFGRSFDSSRTGRIASGPRLALRVNHRRVL